MTDGPDLVVAGAGGGLVAALRAAERGLSVLVVESNPHFAVGNNTSMSTAMVPGAGSRWQREAGIDDSPADFRADVDAKTKGTADPRITRALTEVSAELVEWMADSASVPFSLVTDFGYPGHSRLRCHTIPTRQGRALVSHLVKRVGDADAIDLMVPARLDDVVVGEDGVEGVLLARPDGSSERIDTRAVLLATNGFAADGELVRRHIPEIAGAVYHGSEGSTGDALRIGRELGAAVGYLDAYQGHAGLAMPSATLASWATVMHGAFLVSRDGRRFGDETTGYSEYAAEELRHAGGHAWTILDRRVHEACASFLDYQETVESGALRWGDSAAELAEVCGLPIDDFTGTVEAAAAAARGEHVDEFGRTHWEAPLREPLAAIAVQPALFHTQGGLLVDECARVVDGQDVPIRGLYASGGAAAGMSGHGASGYLAGNGLLPAFGLAYLAATDVAKQLNDH